MSEQVVSEFKLGDHESLALTLSKLMLMECDLEADRDFSDRVLKRMVLRRYCTLVTDQLHVPEPSPEADELDWSSARDVADKAADRAGSQPLSTLLYEVLAPLGADARRYVLSAPSVAAAGLGEVQQRRRALVMMIELAAFHPWPDGTKWDRTARTEGLAELVGCMQAPVDSELMAEVDTALCTSLRRLSRREVDAKKWAVVAVGGAAAGLLTGGLAAPLIGSAVGGAMGLSGAAATSAGLALLGGGAVSAGGLGVAGGTALVAGLAGVGGAGMGAAGAWLKGAGVSEVVVESAKLEVLFEYLIIREERSDELQRLVVERLQQQISALVDEINDLTVLVDEQQRVSAERDELRMRLEEETEKRRVLERTLVDIKRMREDGDDDGGA